eukprot:XP_782480.1 PREDICTED: gamma-butyrobetaine dioxygenase [Strongylocentrotus purpuratus]
MALSTLRTVASRLTLSGQVSSPLRSVLSSNWSRAQVIASAAATKNTTLVQHRSKCTDCAKNCGHCNKLSAFKPAVRHAHAQTQPAINTADEIASVARNTDKDWFEITWKDGFEGKYPYAWIRDNCRCDECYYPSCHQRSMLMYNMDPNVKPVHEELKDGGRTFQIKWTDDHVSPIPAEWLKMHRFDKTDFDVVRKVKQVSWGSEFTDKIPSFDYKDIINEDQALYSWMESLVGRGLVIVRNAPHDEMNVQNICDRVGYERFTCYGSDFRVENIFESSSLGFTTAALGLHLDLPYYDYRPGVQFLNCLRQCEVKGGESQFVDAKRVAETLKKEEPEWYEYMTNVKLDFRLLGIDYIDSHLQHARNLIELDEQGEFKTLAYNDQTRSPYMNVPVEEVNKIYQALKKFNEFLYRKENFIDYKLQPGEIIAFDNNRVMHGRSAYTVKYVDGEDHSRLLIGGFLDWDEIHSRMRLLDERMNGTPRL